MCTSPRNGQHQPSGRWIRPEKRLAIYLRDEFHCTYCNRDLHHVRPCDIALDHVKPLSKHGSNDPTNLITACKSCNSARQDMSISTFTNVDTHAIRIRIRRQTSRSWEKHMELARSIIEDKRS